MFTYIIFYEGSDPRIETHLHTHMFAVFLHQTFMMVLVCLSAMCLELDDTNLHNIYTTLLHMVAV